MLPILCIVFPDKESTKHSPVNCVRKRKVHPHKSEKNHKCESPKNTILDSYRNNFTTHGLSKICTGVTWEKILWFVVLFASLTIVLYFTYGFYIEYKKFDYRTEIRVKASQNITLPTVTICDGEPALDMCYKNKSFSNRVSCLANDTLYKKIYGSFIDTHFTQHKLFSQCILFNEYENVTSKDHKRMLFSLFPQKEYHIWIHDSNDIAFGDHITLETGLASTKYEIIFFDKQITSRLPFPYPSNCSSTGNLFPGQYSVNKCYHSCYLQKMINNCGAVPDEFLRYLPHLKELLPDTNEKTDDHVKLCFWEAMQHFESCKCGVSCHEMNIKHRHFSDHNDHGIYLYFSYESNTFMEIKEIPSYPATKFVTDIGGWLGLFSGISFLSIVEILLFIFLSVLAMVKKLKHEIQIRRGQRHELPSM